MATYQERVNLPNGLIRIRGQLTAQTSTSVSAAIINIPRSGVIIRQDYRLTAGTGTTIDPQISRSSTVFTVPDLIAQPLASPGSPASQASSAAEVPYALNATQFYIRPQPDNGAADHTIDFELLIKVGG